MCEASKMELEEKSSLGSHKHNILAFESAVFSFLSFLTSFIFAECLCMFSWFDAKSREEKRYFPLCDSPLSVSVCRDFLNQLQQLMTHTSHYASHIFVFLPLLLCLSCLQSMWTIFFLAKSQEAVERYLFMQ